MLQLAEDEPEYFIERMKNNTLVGKKSSDNPIFTALIKAPITGKSYLYEKFNDKASNLSGHVITEEEILGLNYLKNKMKSERK